MKPPDYVPCINSNEIYWIVIEYPLLQCKILLVIL
jgi:hypothetical protein